MTLTRVGATLLNHHGDPSCSLADNELGKVGSHLADRLIWFDKQLKCICKQEQIRVWGGGGGGVVFRMHWVLEVFLFPEVYRNEALGFFICGFLPLCSVSACWTPSPAILPELTGEVC